MHTKDKLAAALRAAGLNGMADKAATGYYDEWLSDLAMPGIQLVADLEQFANAPSWPRREEAQALRRLAMAGEFDGTREESEAWANSPEGRETFAMLTNPGRPERKPERRKRGKPERLGDAPIEEAYHEKMNAVAGGLDEIFNGEGVKGPDRETGFVLLVFPFGDKDGSRCNFISNGADRNDIVALFKEMIARFEGQPEPRAGNA